jgi:hypothetical protein
VSGNGQHFFPRVVLEGVFHQVCELAPRHVDRVSDEYVRDVLRRSTHSCFGHYSFYPICEAVTKSRLSQLLIWLKPMEHTLSSATVLHDSHAAGRLHFCDDALSASS